MANLKQFRDKGIFVPLLPVKKEISFKLVDEATGKAEDVTADTYIRKLSAGMIEEIHVDKNKRSRTSTLISEAVREDEGGKKPAFTYQEAYQLKPDLSRALYVAIAEVNYLPKPKGNDEEEAEDPKG